MFTWGVYLGCLLRAFVKALLGVCKGYLVFVKVTCGVYLRCL